MKKVFLIISLIIIGLSVKAQDGDRHVRVHGQENKGVILDAPVSSIDSMYINPNANNPIKIRTTNNLYSFGFGEVDSLTFPWVPTSTGDVVYVNYNGTTAEVINPYPVTDVIVTISEAKVSITSLSSANITYCLSGTANPGRFEIESVTTPTILMNGVNLTNPTGKAMDLTCESGIIMLSLWKIVRMISRLSSTLLCGGQPARGPTSGSEAYLKSASASLSRQGRRMIRSVSIIINNMYAFVANGKYVLYITDDAHDAKTHQ